MSVTKRQAIQKCKDLVRLLTVFRDSMYAYGLDGCPSCGEVGDINEMHVAQCDICDGYKCRHDNCTAVDVIMCDCGYTFHLVCLENSDGYCPECDRSI